MIYLDNNATTRPCEGAVAAARDAMGRAWANPSSLHRAGQEARAIIENARRDAAELVGAKPTKVIFTGSCTEAIDLAVRSEVSHWRAGGERPRVVCSSVEHSAVIELLRHLDTAGEIALDTIGVTREGVYDESEIEARIADGTRLVCVQSANNEAGAIQPIDPVARRCERVGARLLIDAAQWAGKMPGCARDMNTDDSACAADYIAFSPHKFHGVKGVGVLIAREPNRLRARLIGSQESEKRGGTENVPGIAAAAAACREASEWLRDPSRAARCASLRDEFERAILEGCPFASVNGPEPARRLWNTINIRFDGVHAEPMLMSLSERGVAASAGSACSSGSVEPSHILLAMGLSEGEAMSSVRFSISRETTREELVQAAGVVVETARAIRR